MAGTIVVICPASIFRTGLASLLNSMGFDRVLEADDVADIRPQGEKDPELFLASLVSDVQTVPIKIREMKSLVPSAKVVYLADALDVQLLSACLTAGTNGYLLKNISSDALRESLRLVLAGEKVFPSQLAHLIADIPRQASGGAAPKGGQSSDSPHETLSSREAEILGFMSEGKSNKAMVRRLDTSEDSAKANAPARG